MYRLLELSAHGLYDGFLPIEVTGDGEIRNSIVMGNRQARWILEVCLRYAPDEKAREAAVDALPGVPGFGWVGMSPGPAAVVQAFIESGRLRNYEPALRRNLWVQMVFSAAAKEAGYRDPALLAALELRANELPPAGWATRCAEALWHGSFPRELTLASSDTAVGLDGASFIASGYAIAFAPDSVARWNIVRAYSGLPGIETTRFVPLCRNLAYQLGADTSSDDQRNDYRDAIASNPAFRMVLLRAIAEDELVTPTTKSIVGASP